jgi:hypothetical protein
MGMVLQPRLNARYTMRQMRIIAIACLLLTLALPAFALEEAKVAPFDLPNDLTCEFAIFGQDGARIATAYYRVLKETVDGKAAYRFKYVGRNDQLSEASEVWANPDTCLPMRSTRKVVSGSRTLYQDVGYKDGVIVLRSKYEGGEVSESQFPAAGSFFDYEELMWLIAQLDFQGEEQTRFNMFATLAGVTTTVLVQDLGLQDLDIKDVTYQAHAYSYEVNMVPYQQWNVLQDGHWLPARIDMGNSSFVNISLDPAKAKQGKLAAKPAPKPAAKQEPAPTQDGGSGPLGPPAGDGRF